ncbi:archease [Methanobrevibacter oralis]|uniref:Protein archease n=1 Tax=Methanobrevibacter oralis TaxID=66851 RepID=A0A166BEY6_METOA|nr:archease [Methanobrevibacter oralis]KZX13253.1 protein archease [Methanobrevibacter oralis]
MNKFEYFDVTADIGFYAYGNNLNEAFENAGLAIFNIISDTSNIKAEIEKTFEITSEDEVSLLYDYLEELLFLHEIDFMLFSYFKVEIKKDSKYYLRANIKGESIDWNKHERKSEIKAITYHLMSVDVSDKVKLQVIVDL